MQLNYFVKAFRVPPITKPIKYSTKYWCIQLSIRELHNKIGHYSI